MRCFLFDEPLFPILLSYSEIPYFAVIFCNLLILIYFTRDQSNYEEIILRYSKTRAFLAKQAMDILVIVGPHSPFEKYDLACLLYTKVLNKGSFQLVVNTFEDVNDRENLIHRLKLNNKGKGFKQGENSLVASCTTLQMNRKFSQ